MEFAGNARDVGAGSGRRLPEPRMPAAAPPRKRLRVAGERGGGTALRGTATCILHHFRATQLQRAWRRWASVRNRGQDLVTGLAVASHDRLLLVEPDGSGPAYLCSARALGTLFLATARFLHPITRRELHPVELARLCRTLPPPVAGLVSLTWTFREGIQRALVARASLSEYFGAMAGRRLDAALVAAEYGELDATYLEADLYSDAFGDVLRSIPRFGAELLPIHISLADRRRHLCDPDCYVYVANALVELARDADRHTSSGPPAATPPALSVWLPSSRPMTDEG